MDHIISQVDENHDDEVDLSLACSASLVQLPAWADGEAPRQIQVAGMIAQDFNEFLLLVDHLRTFMQLGVAYHMCSVQL